MTMLAIASIAAADKPVVTFGSLLRQMTDRNALAEFPDSPYACRQFSSYDRRSTTPNDPETWFANSDAGNFLRYEDHHGRREAVMMDASGPGAIVRMWSANAKGTLRIYVDDADAPALETPMAALMDGSGPAPPPLSAVRSRGFNLYLPIPYARRCIVTTDEPDSLYYQINYRTYPADTTVESFDGRFLTERKHLLVNAVMELADTDVEVIFGSGSTVTLAPGATQLIYHAAQGGAFTLLRLLIDPVNRTADPRFCTLIIQCDDVETIHVPVSDFFSWSRGVGPLESWPISVLDDGRLVSRWVMPFQHSARVLLANRSDKPMTVTWDVGINEYKWNDRSMYFYAAWRHEGPMKTRPRKDWIYATLNGRGVWVGDALVVSNPVIQWWGEGDEKIYVDGESFPSHFGTGTEDYYGYAWSSTDTFSAPFHNQTRCDGPANFGHTFLNRFRSLDAIPFTTSLKFDMEIWHWADTEVHYAATSFFYLRPGGRHDVQPNDDPAALALSTLELKAFRRPGAIEAESLAVIAKSDGSDLVAQTLGDGAEGTWSGMRQIWCRATRAGDSVDFRVPVTAPGKREIIVYPTRSWDYGVIQFFVNGAKAGEPIDTFNAENPNAIGVPRAHSLGVFDLAGDSFDLGVKVVGTNPASRPPHYYWGLDGVVVK